MCLRCRCFFGRRCRSIKCRFCCRINVHLRVYYIICRHGYQRLNRFFARFRPNLIQLDFVAVMCFSYFFSLSVGKSVLISCIYKNFFRCRNFFHNLGFYLNRSIIRKRCSVELNIYVNSALAFGSGPYASDNEVMFNWNLTPCSCNVK